MAALNRHFRIFDGATCSLLCGPEKKQSKRQAMIVGKAENDRVKKSARGQRHLPTLELALNDHPIDRDLFSEWPMPSHGDLFLCAAGTRVGTVASNFESSDAKH